MSPTFLPLTVGKMLKLFARPALATLILLNIATALADGNTHQYNIPAQSLNNALMQFAADSNLKLLLTADTVRGMTTNGLDGSMTPAQALSQLLQGSGMAYRFVDAKTVTVEPVPSNFRKTATTPDNPEPQSTNGEGQVMPKVTVEADADNPYDDPTWQTDPYNTDYVLPKATAGTKTDTPVMETPLNVQVISKQVLKDQQVTRLDQAFKNISGVTSTTNTAFNGTLGGTQQSIFLRGFESQTFFRNGFRLQQGSASKGLANVESVEVLKGSAAILYGLVEPGGMVNVITKQPLSTPYYGFTQQFGSYDLYRTTLDATGPITKNKDLLYRVNMSYENSGSFRDLVGTENVFFAPVLKWNISPRTHATFELEYNRTHLGAQSGYIPFINGRPLNVPISRNYDEYSPVTTETIFGGFNWSHQFNEDWSIKHRLSVNQVSTDSPSFTRAQFGGTKQYLVKFWTGEENPDPSLIPPNLAAQPNGSYVYRDKNAWNSQDNTYSTNLDVIGHFDTFGLKHTLLTGGDYYRLDSRNLSLQESPANLFGSYISQDNPVHPGTPFAPIPASLSNSTKTDQYGLYIQDQIKLPYDFHIMGGIRYQYIHQSSRNQFSVDFGGNGKPTSSATPAQDAVTPRVGLLWQPKKWLSLYANYVESFGANSGRSFINTGVSTSVAPTSATQYEGGIKTEFFNGKLRTNLAYYDLTKTNVAIGDLTIDPNTKLLRDCGTGPGSCSLAIGAVRSRGPELDITGEILPGWNVIATWANTDITVISNDLPIASGGGALKAGSRLPNVPRNIGRLWSTYEVQDGNYKGLIFGSGVNLRDRQLPNDNFGSGTDGYTVPGNVTFDLMAGYSRQLGDAKISVQLNVNNLLDKRYYTSVSALNSQQGSWADFGQPRTFMGQVSVQY